MRDDPAVFRQHVLIDDGGTPRPLAETADPFQQVDFEAMDSTWLSVAGVGTAKPQFRRAWIERHRGASKSQDAALMALWALTFSVRRIDGVCVAADQQQAAIIRQAIDRTIRLNPWIGEVIEVRKWEATNTRTGSTLTVMSADERSSYGLLLDFVILDEVSVWPDASMWISLLSTAGKKTNCLLLAIMNAGWLDSWAWGIREKVRIDPNWYFSRMDGFASWITEAQLEEQERLLPGPAYRRLWLNTWSDSSGDALERTDIDAACTLDGPAWLRPADCTIIAGLDLSTRRDHSALAILAARHDLHRVQLLDITSWAPGQNGIDLMDVETTIREAHQRHYISALVYDPYQAALLCQRLAADGLPVKEMTFTGANLNKMATGV